MSTDNCVRMSRKKVVSKTRAHVDSNKAKKEKLSLPSGKKENVDKFKSVVKKKMSMKIEKKTNIEENFDILLF